MRHMNVLDLEDIKIKMKKKITKSKSETMDVNHFRVAIFGSARTKKNDPNYKMIYDLAKLIGERNFDIVTGGGPGTMEAANAGHKAGNNMNKSQSYGLLIKLPREQKSNKHLDVKKEFKIFSNRLDNFMALSNVVVVSPGGIGTLLELFYTWQLEQVNQTSNIPIILLGKHWNGLLRWIRKYVLKNGFIDSKDLEFVYHVKNYKQAMEIINYTYNEFEANTNNVSPNLNKYRLLAKYKQ